MAAAEYLEAPAVGLSGGLEHPLNDLGAKGLAACRRDTGEEGHPAGTGGVRARCLHRAAGHAVQVPYSDATSANQRAAGSNTRA